MGKLTKAQHEILERLSQPHILSMSPYALGARLQTIGILARSHLIEQEPPPKLAVTRHSLMRITDAGRAALEPRT